MLFDREITYTSVSNETISDLQTQEKKPRESILRAEFAYAIRVINKDLVEENRLKFIHWDLSKHSRRYVQTSMSFICHPEHAFLELTMYVNKMIVVTFLPGLMYCNFLETWLLMP